MIFTQPLQQLFLPRDLASTLLWLDGNDPSDTGVAPVGALSTWVDKSGKGNNFSQSTPADQPFNSPTYLNAKNAISFNNQIIDSTAFDLTSSFSLLVAFVSNNNSNAYILNPTNSTRPELFVKLLSGNLQIGLYDGSTSHGYFNLAISTNTFYIITYTYDSTANAQLWINGASQGTATTSGYSASVSITHRIGSNYSFNANFNGVVCEHILSSGLWSTNERILMQNYVATKWGITI